MLRADAPAHSYFSQEPFTGYFLMKVISRWTDMTEDNTVPTISYGGSSGGSYGGTGGTGDGGYGGTGGTGGSGIRPLYAATVHHARQSGNLEEMKALAELAEWFLAAEGDIAAELAALKEEIAKLEAASGG